MLHPQPGPFVCGPHIGVVRVMGVWGEPPTHRCSRDKGRAGPVHFASSPLLPGAWPQLTSRPRPLGPQVLGLGRPCSFQPGSPAVWPDRQTPWPLGGRAFSVCSGPPSTPVPTPGGATSQRAHLPAGRWPRPPSACREQEPHPWAMQAERLPVLDPGGGPALVGTQRTPSSGRDGSQRLLVPELSFQCRAIVAMWLRLRESSATGAPVTLGHQGGTPLGPCRS